MQMSHLRLFLDPGKSEKKQGGRKKGGSYRRRKEEVEWANRNGAGGKMKGGRGNRKQRGVTQGI